MRQGIMLVVILPVLAGALFFAARNYGGEVAVLYTMDSDGRTFETSVWVVEHDHQTWVRSVRGEGGWLVRVAGHPQVQLQRGSGLKSYRASARPHRRGLVNDLMAQRYGWAEWLLSRLEDRGEAVPVFLDPFG